eukprot:gnl/TRDRNA2_/TRDRNA2_183005_c0_seq1.p3 gnl/TRDRNA2_/TRDRNA2_183005_c0~~gnl/TRDRNA2_/TRDRNA2_183005_c0_seq1.p3  ORF type:complete len:117 (-),score=23.11 gnl/TRDRNA2_/TRDRNA2_183005_c0_seq1:98-448(-)
MKFIVAMMLALVAAAVALKTESANPAAECSNIKCTPVSCSPPFKYFSGPDSGTCCGVCLSDTVKSPEDRSWAKALSGGIGPNNNADPILCRDVMCPEPHCPEPEQTFDGRCCTKCR